MRIPGRESRMNRTGMLRMSRDLFLKNQCNHFPSLLE